MARPKLAIISEWGEELKQYRVQTTKFIQQYLESEICYRSVQNGGANSSDNGSFATDSKVKVVPGDTALVYNISESAIWDCTKIHGSDVWVDSDKINFAVDNPYGDNDIYYFCGSNKSIFEKQAAIYARHYREHRQAQHRLYFDEHDE